MAEYWCPYEKKLDFYYLLKGRNWGAGEKSGVSEGLGEKTRDGFSMVQIVKLRRRKHSSYRKRGHKGWYIWSPAGSKGEQASLKSCSKLDGQVDVVLGSRRGKHCRTGRRFYLPVSGAQDAGLLKLFNRKGNRKVADFGEAEFYRTRTSSKCERTYWKNKGIRELYHRIE